MGDRRIYLAVPADVAEETAAADGGGWDRFVKYNGTKRIRMRPGGYAARRVGGRVVGVYTDQPTDGRATARSAGARGVEKGGQSVEGGGEWGEGGGAGGKRRYIPAIVVVHAPGHFDSLQPREGTTLVLERSG